MRAIIATILAMFWFLVGAIAHEADLSANFRKYGDAKAWFYEIKR